MRYSLSRRAHLFLVCPDYFWTCIYRSGPNPQTWLEGFSSLLMFSFVNICTILCYHSLAIRHLSFERYMYIDSLYMDYDTV